MRFPSRENDIAVLAEDLIAGLSEHTEFFPSPPSTAEELQASVQPASATLEVAGQPQSTATSAMVLDLVVLEPSCRLDFEAGVRGLK